MACHDVVLGVVIIVMTAGLGLNYSGTASAIYCLRELKNQSHEDLVPMNVNDERTSAHILGAFLWAMPVLLWSIGIFTQIISVNSIFAIPHVWGALGAFLTPAIFRHGFGSLVSLRVVEGLLAGWNAPMLVAVAHYNFDEKWFGLTSGLFFAAWNCGIVAAYPIQSALCSTQSWSHIFYISGCIVLLATSVYLYLILRYPVYRSKEVQMASSWREVFHRFVGTLSLVFRHRNAYILGAVQFLTFAFNMFFYMFIPKYLKDVHQLALEHSSWLTMMPTVAGIVSRLLSGPLADVCVARMGVTASMRILHVTACVIPAILTSLLAFGPALSTSAAVTLLIVICLVFYVFTTSVLMPLGFLYTDLCAFVSGLIGTCSAFGYLATPYLVERLTVSGTAHAWSITFLVVGISPLLVALVLYMFIDFDHVLSSEKLKPLARSNSTVRLHGSVN